MSSSSEIDKNDDDDSGNDMIWLTRKRKHSPSAKGPNRASNTTTKPRLKHAAHTARQQKLSPLRNRLLSNDLSTPKTLSATQYSDHDTNICYNDDSSEESGDRADHPGRNKRSMSTTHLYRSRGHKRQRSTDENDEYEVEKILDACVNCRKIQYRIKWVRYEDDLEWYDAFNFKNSPHKLLSFHSASHTHPGPPKRLGRWVQCWDEDREADNHPDNNTPEQLYLRGGKLQILAGCRFRLKDVPS